MGFSIKNIVKQVANVVKEVASNPVTATIGGAFLGGNTGGVFGAIIGNETANTIQAAEAQKQADWLYANDQNYRQGTDRLNNYRDIFGYDPKTNGTTDVRQFAGLTFDLTEAQNLLLSKRSTVATQQLKTTNNANKGLFEATGSLAERVGSQMKSNPFTDTGFGGYF